MKYSEEKILDLQLRSALKKSVRSFFHENDFLEVDTPILVPSPGTEEYLSYFSTEWIDYKGRGEKLWLRSSPELHMKQLLAQGLEKVYQMGPCFRNKGEFTGWHHPEFHMLEWYQTEIKFDEFIKQTVSLIVSCQELMKAIYGKETIPLSISEEVQTLTVKEAFWEFCNILLADGDPNLAQIAREKGVVSILGSEDFETAYYKILIEKIEPEFKKLGAVVLSHYPPSQAALSKVNNGWAERFELYVNGVELTNGFNELLDPEENLKRILFANQKRKAIGEEEIPVDQDFINSLRKGLQQCCGNALGFDRLLAVLRGHDRIDHSLSFKYYGPFSRDVEPGL